MTGHSSLHDDRIEFFKAHWLLLLVQRRATIVHLENKITGLETDALQDDVEANDLANMGNSSMAEGH